ncbi:MAG: M28 family peptidase [Desulfobacteraceae bacterium]|nr:MAG: M28 family peptidase [Desulfobacteraceae bacterium]
MKFIKVIPQGKSQWKFFALRWAIILMFSGWAIFYVTSAPGESYSGSFKALSHEEEKIGDSLKKHVVMISDTIGDRNLFSDEGYVKLKETSEYISNEFKRYGYNPLIQSYEVESKIVDNIEVEITGDSIPNEIIVIGAHYDSFPYCPGANDNASGIAALLVMAEQFANRSFPRTIKFVAFVNEEPPYFQTENMGSWQYANRARQRGENIVAMVSLETIGHYSDDKGSQKYPPPFNLFYPDAGNFIGFVGNLSSKKLMFQMIKSFRENTAFPSEGIAAPQWISGIGWSDQWSFWEADYDAIMITDTAPFRYRYYHTGDDTWDRLNYSKMARVVNGILQAIISIFGNA